MMKPAVLFAVLAAIIIVVSAQSDDPYRVELLKPRGFRVLRPGTPSILTVKLVTGSINPKKGRDNGIAYSPFRQRGDGWWVYENTNTTLSPGDTLFYTIVEASGCCGVIHNKEFRVPFSAMLLKTLLKVLLEMTSLIEILRT